MKLSTKSTTSVLRSGCRSFTTSPCRRADARQLIDAHPIAGDEVADVGVLDAFALHPRDLAARERLRLERRQESVERDRARVRLQAVGAPRACLPGDEPERVAGADRRRLPRSKTPQRVQRRPSWSSAPRRREGAGCAFALPSTTSIPAGARGGARADRRIAPRGRCTVASISLPLERAVGFESELDRDARARCRARADARRSANGAAMTASSGRRSASAPTRPTAASAA